MNSTKSATAATIVSANALLVKYDYPGNVRELENILERAVVITRGSSINIEDLPFKAPDQISFKDVVSISLYSILTVYKRML